MIYLVVSHLDSPLGTNNTTLISFADMIAESPLEDQEGLPCMICLVVSHPDSPLGTNNTTLVSFADTIAESPLGDQNYYSEVICRHDSKMTVLGDMFSSKSP